MNWYFQEAASPSAKHQQQAASRQQQLTKPPGSLGQLEDIAIQLAALQNSDQPKIDKVAISIFAADHGIAAENVSAFPQVVTGEMIRNFAGGGAAISVLAKQLNAELRVCNLGTVSDLEAIEGVEENKLGPGTANFAKAAAMTEQQLEQALAIGKEHAEQAKASGSDLFIGGEMGIANTTSASALAAALLGAPVPTLVGYGTGINDATLKHKQAVIEGALDFHHLTGSPDALSPLNCLARVGGFEIAALTGAYIGGAIAGITLLVDGFIASVAALAALRINPSIAPWLLLGHQSTEAGHRPVVDALGLQPVLALNMRLGEASGAACAVPLLRLACALHNGMATFDSANISTD